jgi:hypothetical protein
LKIPFFRGNGDDPFHDKPLWQHDIHERVLPYTMTGSARIYALLDAVEYLATSKIPGALVECGVWKGGSMMACAMALQHLCATDRQLYLFDTFAGMPPPTPDDLDHHGNAAASFFARFTSKSRGNWCEAPLREVEFNMAQTGYPPERVSLVEGDVLDTIPQQAPEQIALLRLDTDWYESTKHELAHLYNRVSPNGVVIIDDYGHWRGAKKAVDEFIATNGLVCLLHRIDYTARIFVKTVPTQPGQ